MIRVLFLTNSARLTGGATIALINLITKLKSKGCTIFVVNPETGGFVDFLNGNCIDNAVIEYPPMDIYPYVSTFGSFMKFPFRLIRNKIKSLTSFNKLSLLVEDFRPDIIHTNVGPLFIGSKVAKKYGIPHCWHIREFAESIGVRINPSLTYYKYLLKDPNNHCICITKEVFKHYQLDINKDYVVYDGVLDTEDDVFFNYPKKDYILFVGYLSDNKGIRILLSEYANYYLGGGRLKLWLAGDSNKSYLENCKDYVSKLNISNQVSFLGPRNDVYSLMRESKMVIVPSYSEGFSFVVAEAMFNETIVLGRNIGGIKEQFDNCFFETDEELAYRFNYDYEISSYISIIDSLPYDEYVHKTKLAKSVVKKLYNKDNQANVVLSIYKNILSNRYV